MTDTPTSNVTQADKKFLQTIVELCSLGGTGQALNVVRFYRESAEASQRERDAAHIENFADTFDTKTITVCAYLASAIRNAT